MRQHVDPTTSGLGSLYWQATKRRAPRSIALKEKVGDLLGGTHRAKANVELIGLRFQLFLSLLEHREHFKNTTSLAGSPNKR